MVLCAVVLVVLIVMWWGGRGRLPTVPGKMMTVMAIAAVTGGLAGICGAEEQKLTDEGMLKRNLYGEGGYKKNMELFVDGLLNQYSYTLEVPEQKMTKKEEEEYLAAARKEIEEEFPGENASTDCIREKVLIRESYQDGIVEAEWRFGNYDVIDYSGNIIAERLAVDGELVQAVVWLACGTSSCSMEFYFRIFPPVLDDKQAFLSLLDKMLERQGEKKGEEFFVLPGKVGGYDVAWKAEREYLPEKVLILGGVVALLIPAVERSREQERQKRRGCLLLLEYPDMVNRLALLLGAGLTVQRAFQRMVAAYETKKSMHAVKVHPVYEEMLVTCHEIESGVGEERAYMRFGERCGLAEYRKLGNVLAQNLRKGGRTLTFLLEKEADNVYENRINAAKKCGEEAAAKLLFPMMLMLGVIMVILLVPAIEAFQL